MSEVLVLFDKCGHSNYGPHDVTLDERCPGGREVRLRREWQCVEGYDRESCLAKWPGWQGHAMLCPQREVLVEVPSESPV